MKKVLILATILLLPILAFSFELNSEDVNFANELKVDLQEEVQYQQQQIPPEYYIDKIKAIIDNSIRLFEDKIIFTRYYNVYLLKKNLQTENLKSILKDNKEVSYTIARYIVKNNPHTNDYEALLAIGINPIEAAVMLDNEEYIQSALTKGTITFPYCYTTTTVEHNGDRILHGYTDSTTIEANATREQIAEIKSELLKQEQLYKHSRPIRKFWNSVTGQTYFHW